MLFDHTCSVGSHVTRMWHVPSLLQNIPYNDTGHIHQRYPYCHSHRQLSPLGFEAPLLAGGVVLHGKVTRHLYTHNSSIQTTERPWVMLGRLSHVTCWANDDREPVTQSARPHLLHIACVILNESVIGTSTRSIVKWPVRWFKNLRHVLTLDHWEIMSGVIIHLSTIGTNTCSTRASKCHVHCFTTSLHNIDYALVSIARHFLAAVTAVT